MMKKGITLLILALFMASPALFAQKSEANTDATTIKWLGKKIGTDHYGYIKLKSGYLEMQGEQISGGVFVVDMTSMENTDLENENRNQRLIGHLKSDDFFSVEDYPTSKLEITKASAFTNGKATMSGNLTIKKNTEPISFEVVKDNNTYTTKLAIDRSKYDVRFGSKSFFDNLGDNAIDDIFTLDVKLVMK